MKKEENLNAIRKSLQFSGDSALQMSALDFLNNVCGRKQSLIVALALKEFVERYHLEGKSADEIRVFLLNYDVVKETVNNCRNPLPISFGFSTAEMPKSVVEAPKAKEELSEEDILSSDLQDIAEMFMATA